uniref:Uncharacterized protein n=1 Tax=Anopheles maculatus TaxID=74869 RepID=A0A182T3C3_9DIPT
SGRGRKALNLGATPKNVPQNSAVSPAPASLPHPSPNTTTGNPSTPNLQVQANQSQQQPQLVTVSGAQTGTAAPPTAANTAASGVHNSVLLGSGPSQHQHQQQQHQQQAQLQHHLARHPPIPGAPPPGGGGGGPGNLQQQQQQHQSIVVKSEPSVEVMKDQPQQPMVSGRLKSRTVCSPVAINRVSTVFFGARVKRGKSRASPASRFFDCVYFQLKI